LPDHIGKYEILGELGRGGFGQVFLGFDPTVRRKVAIKVLTGEGDASNVARFRTEAAASGSLHHKNIVTIHEFGEDRGTFFMVMEYLEGRDLQEIIRAAQPLSLLEKVRIMTQAAEGLYCAHQSGIVHRDVKPANIMVLGDGVVKVMDFGIARLTSDNAVRLTQSGFLVGTVFYMAPEQLNGFEADARCDIWAFGSIYYELLGGRHPFEAPDTAAGMFRIMHAQPEPIQQLCPECPDALAAVLTRLLTKDREGRYQSFEDVLFDTTPILLALESREVTQLIGQARQLIDGGNLDQAESLVKRILTLDPAHGAGRALRKELQLKLREHSFRIRIETFVAEAERAAAARNFDAAIEAFESAARLDSGDTSFPPRLAELRAAKERADLAAKMVQSAHENLRQGNVSAASRLLSDALNAEPGNSEAQRLMGDVNDKLNQRDAEKRLRDGLAKIRGLLAFQSFDEAVAELETLAREAPASDEVRATLEQAKRQREENRRSRRIRTELDAAKGEIKAHQFEAAITRLEPLVSDPSAPSDVAALLTYARSESEAAQRTARIKASGAEAWRLLKAGQFDQALTQVEAALLTFPDEPTLHRLRQAIVAQREEDRQRKFVQQALQQAAQLDGAGRTEQACACLETALRTYSAESSLLEALARTKQKLRQQQEQVRAAALAREVQQATAFIEQGQLLQATQLLEHMKSAYPGEAPVASLVRRVRVEEQRTVALHAMCAQIQGHLDAGKPDQASEAATRGRAEFGLDPALIALEAAAQKMLARKDALHRARAAARERKWRAAAEILEALAQQDPQDAETGALLEEVLENERVETRRARRDKGRQEAQKLMQDHRFEDAVKALRTLHNEFPDDVAVRDDLSLAVDAINSQVRRDTYGQGRQKALTALRAGRFADAIKVLDQLQAVFPNDSTLAEDLKEACAAQQEQVRRERYASERRASAALLQARKFDDAVARLQALLLEFPGDAALADDLTSALGAREMQQQREALDQQVAQLEKLYRKGDARAVEEKASLLPSDLQDARVRELLDWARSEIQRSQQERESAETLRKKRKQRNTIIAAAVGVVAAVAILVPLALRKGPTPGSLSAKPTQLSFTFGPGAAPSSQDLLLESAAPGVHWSASSPEDWLTVAPTEGVTPAHLTVSVDPRRLAPANYSAQLIFTGEASVSVRTNVKVAVTAPAAHPSPAESQQKDTNAAPIQAKSGVPAATQPGTKQGVPLKSPPPVEVPPQPGPTAESKAPVISQQPLPDVANCDTYRGSRDGTLTWEGSLDPDGVLVIGGSLPQLAGGKITQGRFPYCAVSVGSLTSGIMIDEMPSLPDHFSRVKLHNSSAQRLNTVILRWTMPKK
jgi:serine/threonine-protein kinase